VGKRELLLDRDYLLEKILCVRVDAYLLWIHGHAVWTLHVRVLHSVAGSLRQQWRSGHRLYQNCNTKRVNIVDSTNDKVQLNDTQTLGR